MIDAHGHNEHMNRKRTRTTSSHSSRPLRQPLSPNSMMMLPISGSLPIILPSSFTHKVRVSSFLETGYPAVLIETRESSVVTGHDLSPSNASRSQSAVAATAEPNTIKTTTTTMEPVGRAPRPEQSTKRQVRFRQVQLCYFNEQPHEEQHQEEQSSVVVMGLDDYERQRGPPRARRFFIKSSAELRRVRRVRQIEDRLADAEWRAIRRHFAEVRSLQAAEEEETQKAENSFEEKEQAQYSFEATEKKARRNVFSQIWKRSNRHMTTTTSSRRATHRILKRVRS